MLKDLRQLWDSLPFKAEFAVVALAWTALFHWIGNSSLGYIDTPSTFVWLGRIYDTADKFDNDDAFGRFVPFLVLALALVRTRELAAATKRLWAPALGLIVLALAIHVAGFKVQQTRLSLLAYLVGLFGVMGLFWGREWLRTAFFPYFLLSFAVPINAYLDPITNKLRILSAIVSAGICSGALSMRIERHGAAVWFPAVGRTPAFPLEVAAACSGIRSATVILLLTIAFGWLNFTSPWRRLVLVLASIPLALIGNVARLVFTFCVAEMRGRDAASMVETKAGAVTFIVALAGVFALGRLLRERPTGREATPPDGDDDGTLATRATSP